MMQVGGSSGYTMLEIEWFIQQIKAQE